MTEASTFENEVSDYNAEIEGINQTNLMYKLRSNPEDFSKLLVAELGFPTGIELTKEGLGKFYKSSGLEAKVASAKTALSARVSKFLQPYKDRLSTGIDSLKGYFSNGIDALREKGQAFVDDSLTGLKGVVTGAARAKLDDLEGQFNQLKEDVGGRYKDAVNQLESLKRQGIEEGSARYRAAVEQAESLKSEFSSRVEDLQNKAKDTLASAQSQIEEKARAVGENLKGKAQGVVDNVNSRVSAARSSLEDLQARVASGASELAPQLEQAKARLQSATTERIAQLQKLSPEVLQSVQESARSEYLQAQERLSNLEPEEEGYTQAFSEAQGAQQRLSSAISDLSERAASLSSLGQDALQARKAAALEQLEGAKQALSSAALSGSEDVSASIKAAQDKLIEAQTNFRGTLVDLGEHVEGLGSNILGSLKGLGSTLGEDLLGALPVIGMDLGENASMSRIGEDTGMAAAFNRGTSVLGSAYSKAKSTVGGIVKRYQGLTPKSPTVGVEASMEDESGGVVETMGGDFDALAGDTAGVVKNLSSTFVRTGRPSAGFLQSLFGDVSARARTLVPDEIINGVDTLGEDLGGLGGAVQSDLASAKSLASTFLPREATADGLGGAARGFFSQARNAFTNTARSAAAEAQSMAKGALAEATAAGRGALADAQTIAKGVASEAQTAARGAVSNATAAARSAAADVQSSVTNAARGAAAQAQSAAQGLAAQAQDAARGAASQAEGFTRSQALHPTEPISSNIEGAEGAAAAEQDVISGISKATGLDLQGSLDALASKATAVQGGILEGGAGEIAAGAEAAAEGVGEAAAGGAEAAGEAIAESTGESGFGAIIGGLGILGGVLYDVFGTHEAPPPVIPIPNYSIPVFAPGGH